MPVPMPVSIHMPTCMSIHMSVHMSIHMFTHMSVHMSTDVYTHVYRCLYTCLHTHAYIHVHSGESIHMSIPHAQTHRRTTCRMCRRRGPLLHLAWPNPPHQPAYMRVYPSMRTPCHSACACALRCTNMRAHGQAGERVGVPPSPSMPLLVRVPLVLASIVVFAEPLLAQAGSRFGQASKEV